MSIRIPERVFVNQDDLELIGLRTRAFLRDLRELCMRHQMIVDSCGCCGSIRVKSTVMQGKLSAVYYPETGELERLELK